MKKTIICAVLALTISGCATRDAGYVPMVDTKGRDTNQLAVDTAECQQYAQKQAGAGTGAVVGAVAGALIGALLMSKGYRNYGATRGAVFGAMGGASGANEAQENVTRRCLQGRGYQTLN